MGVFQKSGFVTNAASSHGILAVYRQKIPSTPLFATIRKDTILCKSDFKIRDWEIHKKTAKHLEKCLAVWILQMAADYRFTGEGSTFGR
ncbi:TPA: hypothetical protein DDW35_07030 [Candidatus Sumerlaeota bacterium]|jgi:hypothetical protein|nr:hypothetical protein [Candidatus Sumerlaeota bacterium]